MKKLKNKVVGFVKENKVEITMVGCILAVGLGTYYGMNKASVNHAFKVGANAVALGTIDKCKTSFTAEDLTQLYKDITEKEWIEYTKIAMNGGA